MGICTVAVKQLIDTSTLIVLQYLCCSCSSSVRGLLRQGIAIAIAIAAGLGRCLFGLGE